jgi:hypothetical protein
MDNKAGKKRPMRMTSNSEEINDGLMREGTPVNEKSSTKCR